MDKRKISAKLRSIASDLDVKTHSEARGEILRVANKLVGAQGGMLNPGGWGDELGAMSPLMPPMPGEAAPPAENVVPEEDPGQFSSDRRPEISTPMWDVVFHRVPARSFQEVVTIAKKAANDLNEQLGVDLISVGTATQSKDKPDVR